MHPSGSHTHPRGTRVVVRYRLPAPDPVSGARNTDVIGALVADDADTIVLDTERGRVTVPRAAVIATRVIPPRPSRRGAPHRALPVEDLERVMVGAWPPREQEHLGQWVLRAAAGFTSRANSALVVGHPDRPVPEALETVEQWYASRGLPAVLAVPVAPGLRLEDDDVAARAMRSGWTTLGEPVLVLTGATRQLLTHAPQPVPGVQIETTERITDAWFAAYARSRAVSRPDGEAVLEGSPAQWFAAARSGGSTVVGVGRVGISSGWAGIGAMWVDPAARSRGIGTTMLRVLLEQGLAHGCVSTHLQVEATNDTALRLYRGLGFTEHHTYGYLHRGEWR